MSRITRKRIRPPRPRFQQMFMDRLESRVLLSLTVPAFDSKPGAKATLYLDFDGDTTATWDTYHPGTTPAFTMDADATSFSNSELSAITEICQRVAEKYSPFDVNVTTTDPGTLRNGTSIRIVVGGNGGWTGGTYGGISYVGAFINSEPNTGWAFSSNLSNSAKNCAEAASHEAGHMFGLQHQSLYDSNGNKTVEYYAGDSQRAPVMGNSYAAARGLWWYGHPATSSTAYQDDVAVISSLSNGFGYRADEAGGTLATAATLIVAGNQYSASGVITTISDVDEYAFTVATSGTVSFHMKVAAFGPMLDAKLLLQDAAGNPLSTADTSTLGEDLTLTLTPGTYYVAAESHGNTGDIGQYTLTGSFAAAAPVAPTTPSGLVAEVVSPTQVHLTWTDQSDNETRFQIESSIDGANWTLLGSVGSNITSFDDSSAQPGGSYEYRVSAFNDTAQSGYALTSFVTTWGGGSGLHADYFNAADLSGDPVVSQTDSAINFNWQSNSPAGGIDPQTYSVRWTGRVQPLESGSYLFVTTADDGVRLWVNGQLLIDRWTDVKVNGDLNGDGVVDATDFATMYQNMGQSGGAAQGDLNGDGLINFADFQLMELNFGNGVSPVTDSGAITLQAGAKYDITLEYYQQSGPASIKLEWITPSQIQEVIPQSALFLPLASPAAVPAPLPAPLSTKQSTADKKKQVQSIFSLLPIVKPQPLRIRPAARK